ncbi:thiolase family protein [Cytobacillus sp. FSL W7-1323]|uniref:acetyl-CoA C-acetyltransferase n=1 Tax=Cytobacillus kochii TaxID=859143 RepID=A0A248TET4_9BACI|nr:MULTISPECIES: thiolase family protein [Cytobacillus]ASV66728.1 acetyl-CoA acetyltransferase [Cytobacillus kochii]MDQ0186473.1 acetyl-CoA C-acetyltransferase [Cytobacillus kochii]MEA1854113.1 thiolase family protein [Cytobacillus sp. OWB-43]MED1607838.1 thiolase family protein [Cytobacillus kochii]
MKDVVIVEAKRTAIGKLGGSLGNETVDFLASHVLKGLMEKMKVPKNEIDEIIIGQAKQSADASNLARLATLRAGFPESIPSYTLHRQCGSGVQSVHSAAQQIMSGFADVVIAGGAESMSTAPYYMRNIRFGLKSGNGLLLDPNTESQPGSQPVEEYGQLTMGMTAENLAEKYRISRMEQDEFALRSQENARSAITAGFFEKEILPYTVNERKKSSTFMVDEHPRVTTIEKLSQLKPVFKQGGTVTAGNSSGRNDGAAALLLMSREKADEFSIQPKVKIIAQAAAGVDPRYMGIGPVPATQKALKQVQLTIEDMDIIELNEAFSAQALAVIKELGLSIEKVNPNGGAIAMGHPIGATGSILLTKAIHELERTGKKYALVTLCIAGGLGISTIIENLQI